MQNRKRTKRTWQTPSTTWYNAKGSHTIVFSKIPNGRLVTRKQYETEDTEKKILPLSSEGVKIMKTKKI